MKRIRPYPLIRAIRTIAKPSDFIPWIEQLSPGPVVLYGRASRRNQKASLMHQLACRKAELERRGFTVVAIFWEIVPGWEPMYCERWGRFKLESAIFKAKETKAVLVAESVDRLRRHYNRDWKKGQPQPPLSLYDLNQLKDESEGVQLATLIHPDTPEDEVRGEQTKRGQAGTGHYGGRPKEEFPKKARREKLLPIAVKLWKKGWSHRRIAARLNMSFSTVRDWIKREIRTPYNW